jgi:uncharacterized membrane protein
VEAATDEQEAIGTLLLWIGVGQLVLVQLLPVSAGITAHEATGTLVLVTVVQLVVVQLLPLAAAVTEQVCIGTAGVTVLLHVVVV